MKQEFKVISQLIEEKSHALDVGCGDGSLMNFLKEEKNIEVRGLELNQENVQQCIHKGLPVIQGNAETELHQFPDQSFDYVVLSQTLQAFYNPEEVLKNLLRIGKAVVVSIPNFGYWKVRMKLLFFGEMPVTKVEIVHEIAECLNLSPETLAGLEKAPKAALKALQIAAGSN